ncbi:CPBP family intramembrane glutamic endopeptidase [Acidicapsa ligni]|uniref:CPBP family intramembrane glutamic endopeptidase n=1 Tax=Acidicapsa ligni TaxID=542300 RepID=UPI0021E061C3|nr:CPBP family intramembrane glutamic endopeptidase [Acidicapsa ligni]
MTAPQTSNPFKAASRVVLAAIYFFLARILAHHGAQGLVSEDWLPLAEQAMFAFLLLLGYAGIGFSLDRQLHPISLQGLPRRSGWLGEAGMGLAIGWAIAVLCVLPMVFFGGIALHFSFTLVSFRWLIADAAFFALATLAIEIAFRGYPFQRAIDAIGELPAVLLMSVLYGILLAWLPNASHASMAVNIVLGLLLAMAYLRTRALWLPWGLSFGWVASRALLFGLPVNGIGNHSSVVQGYPMGPLALTGGDFGLEGTWLAFVVLLLALFFVYRATSDLSFIYNAPVLKPAGMPVDLDAAAKRQHETATRPEVPEVKPLVQILPATPPPLPVASDLDRPANPFNPRSNTPGS